MKKRLLILVICILVFTQLSGCIIPQISSTSNKEKSETTTIQPYTLSKRQKQILKDESLPTNYDELDISQKIAIEAIEDMLEYLENKYKGETFTYSGYVLGQFMDKEHLIANSDYGEVTVYRELSKDKTEYEDDFEEVKAGVKCEGIISNFLAKHIDSNKFLLNLHVSNISAEYYENNDLLGNCNIGGEIFLHESIGEKGLNDIYDIFSDYIFSKLNKDKGITVHFTLVEDEVFSPYLLEHSSDYYCMQHYIKEKTLLRTSNT